MQQYATYLSLCDKAKGPSNLTARALLDWLASQWAQNLHPQVMHTIQQCPVASTTALHRHLKSLQKAGYIRLAHPEGDQRYKNIYPAPKAMAYIAAMEAAIREAVQP
jgi:hypothetical protein